MTATIGIDPHKASHTAVALDEHEDMLGQLRVLSGNDQLARLTQWANAWPERTWAIENASGLGHLLAQQLVSAGERVLDVRPKLAARARLLNKGDVNKDDPNDARSVAVAAMRAKRLVEVAKEDHTAVMKILVRRHKFLTSTRTRVANRIHAVILELVAGGYRGEIYAPTRSSVSSRPWSPPEPSPVPGRSWPRRSWSTSGRLDAQLAEVRERLPSLSG